MLFIYFGFLWTIHILHPIFHKGIDVPLIGEKRPRAGTRVRTNKQQQAVVQVDESLASEENKVEQNPEDETEVLVEEEEEVKDSWDAESSSEEEVEEVSVPAATTTTEPTHSKSKSESEDTENSSEEDESNDSEDSENEEEGKKTDALSRREKALYRIQVCPLFEIVGIMKTSL